MCKHILNAQVAIRAPCCRRFFDCPLCHEEAEGHDHRLRRTTEMQFVCKQCKRAFRKDLTRFEEEDEFCPHCDNHFVVEAKTSNNASSYAEENSMAADGQSAAAEAERAEAARAEELLGPRGMGPGHDVQALLDERMRYDPRRDWIALDLHAGEKGERIDEGGLVGALQQREQADRDALRAAKNVSTMMNALHHEGVGATGGFDDDDLDWS